MESVQPLGDQALLAVFADESAALHFAAAVRRQLPPWILDVVQAYTSVALFYDMIRVDYKMASAWATGVKCNSRPGALPGALHDIPCCYELQFDLERVAAHLRLSPDEVIRLHVSTVYTVYAIGFSPGFPY